MTLADGAYIGLPMADYLADPALSGSAFYNLLTEPGAITWDTPANPLFDPDAAEKKTLGQTRGSAAHCAILEGLPAYEAAYCIAPNGALRTGEDMSAWLARAKARRDDFAELRTSGKVAELRARIEEARQFLREDDPLWPSFFDEKVGGRTVLSAGDDAYVRMLTHFIRSNPKLAKYLCEGLPELTLVLTLDGVRYKCRIDYLSPQCDLDLKSYGRPPNIDMDLKRHLVRQAFYNGAHLQAAHNARMSAAAGALALAGKLPIHGSESDAALLQAIFRARAERPAVFRWLFVRMDGPLACMLVPFRQSDGMYQKALDDIETAVSVWRSYVATCGDGIWITDHGEQEIDDVDWPIGAWEGRV